MKKTILFVLFMIIMINTLSGCRQNKTSKGTENKLDNGVSAIEDEMSKKRTTDSPQQTEMKDVNDLRDGTSADTVATPNDFPNAYDYGSGKISDYSRNAMLRKMPKPDGNQTVFNTEADANHIQALYLWEEGNVPAKTKFTKDMTGYFDKWNFRPYVTAIPVKKGVTAKGAVVLMAGVHTNLEETIRMHFQQRRHLEKKDFRLLLWIIDCIHIHRKKAHLMLQGQCVLFEKMQISTELIPMQSLLWDFPQEESKQENF